MRKNQLRIPKSILTGLAEDIQVLMQSNPGRIAVLDMIEELPYEIRNLVFESLSAFYSVGMVQFFHLLQDEYGSDVKDICNRALSKYAMAGLNTDKTFFFKGTFHKAYASCSRSTGRITLDVAWHKKTGGLHVECFYLTFNQDGVHSFFLIPNMPIEQYNLDREILSYMVEITEEEAAFLIGEAYNWNLCKMTRPAVGKFLYNKYLEFEDKLTLAQQENLLHRLSGKLTPRQIINSFYSSLKYRDFTYLSCICSNEAYDLLEKTCPDLLGFNSIILAARADKVFANLNRAEVTARSMVVNDNKCYYLDYRFFMSKLSSFWTIEKIELVNKIPIAPQAPENPHNLEVFCRVYEIVDLDDLFKFLDKMDNINEIVEVPYGIHLKITSYDDEFNQGISFLGDSIADIIINGDEFVLICDEADILQDFHTTLFYESVPPLIPRGEYQIDLVTAYNYVNGRYMSFEDILIADSDDLLGENDLRFMSTVYFVKDRQPVLTKIRNTPNVTCVIDGEFSIFYQYEFKGDDKVVLAEYVLGDDWLTLSTFGFDDMFLVRETFEPSLYKYLEIEGTEIKKGGFFDILTEGMKQNYPDLEKFLKELYLNKWYNSQLSVLEGMTPSEASETEEGKKLLWTLIKKIHQNDACNLGRGKRSTIKVNEYINLIEEKRKEKP